MDKIYLEGLKLTANIGVFEWEKKVTQTLYLDLTICTDLSKAGFSDELEDTLDYGAIAEQMHVLAVAKHYQLLEHLAETLCQALLENIRIETVTVKLHKPAAVANTVKTGVEISRTRSSHS